MAFEKATIRGNGAIAVGRGLTMSDDLETHVDAHTGTATTGHEWDGIRELNTPLPRWWLWTFYACIAWAFGYWIAYPAWPLVNGSTSGVLGWHSRAAVRQDIAELQTIRGPMSAKLAAASLDDIEKSPELLSFAQAEGAAVFANNCAPCHGAGAQGSRGYPNLNADRWLWGGKLAEIAETITHGARWDSDPKTHASMMPAFGHDGVLKPDEVEATANFVRSLSGLPTDPGANLELGKKVFADNCSPCHGDDGKGNQDFGAPNLTTKVWLYGSDKKSIIERITNGGGGIMPAWGEKLDPTSIKAVAVYVHTLGGGK
jgi:cytochrome c oxidase cbb3-type subunit 3